MRFSIVTPSFRQAAFLPECLASVRTAAARATGHEVEHLVLDGGSEDGTVEILRKAEDVQWVSEPDRGQTHAINKGLARSRGEVLAYLCSDDLYEPDSLRLVAGVFAARPEVDVVYGDYYFLEGRSGWKRRKVAGPFSPERLDAGNFLSQPAVWWRRRVYERFGGFDESLRYCMDHEYWLRIARGTRWHYLAEPLATARLHGGSKTGSQLAEAWTEAARMLTRQGWRWKPWAEAMAMRLWGRHFYRAKRFAFEQIGLRRRRGVAP